jgi:transcriptional regulator with XRE-family HTH domain
VPMPDLIAASILRRVIFGGWAQVNSVYGMCDSNLSFPERLRAERKRLVLTQEEFGRLGNVSKTAQWLYEAGKNWPTVEYLEALKAQQVDIGYIVTGARSQAAVLDWKLLRNAFLLVQENFAERADRSFSADQLFDAFRTIVEAAMGVTRPDLVSQQKVNAENSVMEARDD